MNGWWLRKSSSRNKNLWLQSLENDLKLFQKLMPSAMLLLKHVVVEDLVKGVVKEVLLGFEDEESTVGRNKRYHWKEEEKLGRGAHEGQSDLSRITGAMGL
ncbi:hypothetical protein BY996DRAFT_6441114 [Phakopsora pachyrhizi]|nr:hypothetical protein BY996DRAFT_6441114 [Phakopsora pachyrhizi]